MIYIRSTIFFILHAVTAVLFSCLGVLLWPLPFKWRYAVVSQWAKSNIWLLDKICQVKLEVEGRQNIGDKPAVIICKHQSSWETLALQAVFPPQVWVLKRELFWIPFFGWGLASLNPIAIDRKAGRKALNQVIEQGLDRLSSGAWVVIFPEGTRIAKGYIGRFGIGGARLAKETGYPVIPVCHDAGKSWPKHGFLKYPGVIKMTIGKKMATDSLSAAELNQQLFDWMELQQTKLEGKKPMLLDKKKEQ
ncbi:lysophospholipid acyltransferase family protein [Methylophaga thalassica]|jgi:1-acyl-sn-glycerol-3-phosphate acyltransferase|uniref:Lysophosphatidic acid acyltransferase n=1 Tax=Methylophaga thalassica TaxID=40223 RepID=A0ABQ5TZW1_9GAMM|nr:lysophospholipid acyltransferase family protein [Methylophaga thalassica]WVI85765.1 lysophospholipid acyltransferase family protein [Methylophaga thalassica]GLQ00948.1 lysophosphatidic acid acyltransferase [Methylophaga thalassica]